MKLVGRIPKAIVKQTFLELWDKKGCELPFTRKDFEYWCDEKMPSNAIAVGIEYDDGSILGGFIAYPVFLPPCLFIQLMITLKPGDRELLRKPMINIAKVLGYDTIAGVCPINIATGMERLFPWKEAGKFFSWRIEE